MRKSFVGPQLAIFAALGGLGCLALAAAVALPTSADAEMARGADRNAPPDLSKDEEFRYAIGDQLKITIFEQLKSEATAPGAATLSLLERTEFSGDYVVQRSGDILLPIIGAVRVAQQPRSEVEKALVRAAAEIVGGNLRASVVVTERQPVYITGPLPRSGSYRYTPGMLVAEAVALAGGGEDASTMLWQKVDLARERERLRKSTVRLKRLLAELAVLEGERKGLAPRAPARLVALARTQAPVYLREAEEARQLERSKLAAELSSLERQITATEATLAGMREHKEQMAVVVIERTERFNRLNARVEQGRSTEHLLIQAKNELVEIETRWHELGTGISRSEIRLLELQGEHEKLRLNADVSFDTNLRAARNGIADEEVTLATVGQLLRSLGEKEIEAEQALGFVYVVVRRTPSGLLQMDAELLTPLEPGDIIQVTKAVPTVASIPVR